MQRRSRRRCQVLEVGVALDLADLAGVDLLLQHVERVRRTRSSVKSLRDVHALAQHDQPDRVAHLGEHHDLALEVGRPEVVERLELAADLVLA